MKNNAETIKIFDRGKKFTIPILSLESLNKKKSKVIENGIDGIE
jgi:hypothetical protein